MQLFADRFLVSGSDPAVDLASGRRVEIVIATAGGVSEQAAWESRCAWFHSLRHPCIAALLDYGLFGEGRRFEAWHADGPFRGAAGSACAVVRDADRFLHASGVGRLAVERTLVRQVAGRAVVVPDELAGRSCSLEESGIDVDEAVRPGVLSACAREVMVLADALHQLREPGVFILATRDQFDAVAACLALARESRMRGFVPVGLEGDQWPVDVVSGRSVCLLARGDGASAWRRFLALTDRTAKPHALVFAGLHDVSDSVPVVLHRSTAEQLMTAIVPPAWVRDHAVPARRAVRRADGHPERLAHLIAAGADVDLRFARLTGTSPSHAAEPAASYGHEASDVESRRDGTAPPTIDVWPVSSDVAALRQRLRRATAQYSRDLRPATERMVRHCIGALARRHDWVHAALGGLDLARGLLRRGRPGEARRAIDLVNEHAAHSDRQDIVVAAVTVAGVISLEDGRVDEAETRLRSAWLAAGGLAEPEARRAAALALARCLFWRGKYQAGLALLDTVSYDEARGRIRVSIERSRLAIGAGDLQAGVREAIDAATAAAREAPELQPVADYALAFAHLAVGDHVAVSADAARSIAGARRQREPLLALRARLLADEAARRSGRPGLALRLGARVRSMAAVPSIVKARATVLHELAAGDGATAVERHARTSGLTALTLYGGAVTARTGSSIDIVGILEVCQRAGEDQALLVEVCGRVRASTGARAVGFFARDGGRWHLVGSDGGHLDAEIASRIEAVAQTIVPHTANGIVQGGAPVRYAGRILGVLAGRWAGPSLLTPQCGDLLAAAACAAAPALASLLARRHAPVISPDSDLLGASDAMAAIRRNIARAGVAPFPVLIEGESGAGKELVARAIHRASTRRERTLVTLNCAALPDDLVESELFGHARGAFTGAAVDRPGVFEAAHLGTVFLDEIGELSPRAQAKVLRVVQEGEVRRLGETIARRVDVRLIAATNRDLRRESAAGRFRVDLLYRLDVIRIAVAPLRERREDIALLAERFWRDASDRIGGQATLATSTIAALARYDWPGNVRELQNVLFALAARSPRRGVIMPDALPPLGGAAPAECSWRLDHARRTFDTQFVRAALTRTGGHRGRAAADLGITRQGLAKLIARLGLERTDMDRDEQHHSCCGSS